MNALTKQMQHVQAVAASLGGAEKLAAGAAEAARVQQAVAASLGGAEKLAAGAAEAARVQQAVAASLGGAEKLAAGAAEAARVQQAVAASLGGAEKLAAGAAEAARVQQAVAASLGGAEKLAAGAAEAARVQQAVAASLGGAEKLAAGAAEAARVQQAVAAQVAAVARRNQTFTAKIGELVEAQEAFVSAVADTTAVGRLQLNLRNLQPEALGSLAMSDSLVGLAGIAATRIEAAGFTDHFASALESVVEALPSSDVEAELEASEPTSEELLADHSELVHLVGPNLDPVTTRVLLAVLVVASLPFLTDAVFAISLEVLGQCWEALKLVEEITSLNPAISGLLTVLTIWGIVYRRS